jgi:hypothetical protein
VLKYVALENISRAMMVMLSVIQGGS